jgi:general secretion pathway protein B
MSFILDALKKSETERQRQTIPGLVDSGIGRPRSRLPLWAIGLCLLLAINLIVLLLVLTRGRSTPAAAETAAPVAAARTPSIAPALSPAAATEHPFSPLDGAPEYAPEIPVPAPAASSAIRQPAAGPAIAPAAHETRRRDPVLSNDDYKPADEEVLPSINEIHLSGAQALPELHLDVHVYATQSAERFVFINMRKYHEGATLEEGPTIERIRRDGVILDYQGLRFLLPRQ